MENNVKSIIDKISKFKLQLIINKNLFSSNVISSSIYEQMESSLLEKIETLKLLLQIEIIMKIPF